MKRTFLAALVFLIPFALTSCTPSWNDLNTPTKFLKKADFDSCCLSLTDNFKNISESDWKDYNLEIKDALLKAGPFTKVVETVPDSENHFLYVNAYKNGFVGLYPTYYCIMSIYDDGYIQIDYQQAEGHKYAYFSMDGDKAKAINEQVVNKIATEKQIKEEDKSQAYQDGDIANFIKEMETKSSIKTKVEDRHLEEMTKDTYNFSDNGEILSLIKDAEYTHTSNLPPLESSETFYYNLDNQKGTLPWSYYLYDSFDYVKIYYSYVNRLKERLRIEINYHIDATKGKEIVAKALEIAKR